MIHPQCRFCGKQLSVDRHNHIVDAENWGAPHECIVQWRKINRGLDHGALGRQAKRSKERAIYHELSMLLDGAHTTLQQLGIPLRQVADIICHMRHSGIPIQSAWQIGKSSRFGLLVKERVYWLEATK